jgi:hypothetical protein
MPRTFLKRQWDSHEDRAACYPDDLLPELQQTLATLAYVELRHEAARECAAREPDAVRSPSLVEIEARYQRERQPYVERLEQLQNQIRCLILGGL